MAIKERIAEFVKVKEISIYEFEKRCCLSKGFVRNIANTIGVDKLESILSAFPDLNANWLITGNGPMLINLDDVREFAREAEKFLNGHNNGFAQYFAPTFIDKHKEVFADNGAFAVSESPITIQENISQKEDGNTIEKLTKEVELLNRLLDEKERFIQHLTKGN